MLRDGRSRERSIESFSLPMTSSVSTGLVSLNCTSSQHVVGRYSLSKASAACRTKVYRDLGSVFLVPNVGTENADEVSIMSPLVNAVVSSNLALNVQFGSLSHRSLHLDAISSTIRVHKSIPFVLGSKWPYHQPSVLTSPESVFAATDPGGEPRG